MNEQQLEQKWREEFETLFRNGLEDAFLEGEMHNMFLCYKTARKKGQEELERDYVKHSDFLDVEGGLTEQIIQLKKQLELRDQAAIVVGDELMRVKKQLENYPKLLEDFHKEVKLRIDKQEQIDNQEDQIQSLTQQLEECKANKSVRVEQTVRVQQLTQQIKEKESLDEHNEKIRSNLQDALEREVKHCQHLKHLIERALKLIEYNSHKEYPSVNEWLEEARKSL